MNVKKIMSIFQSFYVDVSIEELTLTLPISFVKRFEYTQLTFHKESFLLIKEKRRGSLSSFECCFGVFKVIRRRKKAITSS